MAEYTGQRANASPSEKDEVQEREVPPSLGALLRTRREEMGISVRLASQLTRISTAFIVALEDDDLRSLPGEAYALGFIRTYAEYLGLDPDAMATCYKTAAAQYDGSQPFWARHQKTWAEIRSIFLAMLVMGTAWAGYMLFESRYLDIAVVEIMALRDCDLVVEGEEGREPRPQQLRAGDRLVVRKTPTLRVVVDDADAVAINMKGVRIKEPDFLVYKNDYEKDSRSGE